MRKNSKTETSGHDEKPGAKEMFPEAGSKPANPIPPFESVDPAKFAPDPLAAAGLNTAIDAVEDTPPVGAPAEGTVDNVGKMPPIQPPGAFPTAEDAYADMSEPMIEAPVEFVALNHGTQVPQDAFRAIPQDKYISLYMFNLPYGTAQKGEAFTQAVDKKILDQIQKECPQLVLKRFEIRLLQRADGSYYLLEVSADPAKKVIDEHARQSLLRVLDVAATKWTLTLKIGGVWSLGDAGFCTTVHTKPHQSYKELVDRTYGEIIHRDMSRPVLQRYRRKV
jgi:hypothetical protein